MDNWTAFVKLVVNKNWVFPFIYLLSLRYKSLFFQVWKMMMRSVGCNIFSVITSRLESSVVIQLPCSLGNDAFDIYSCGTSVPDALVVCSLFYWAWWVSLSLLLSSTADSVTTAIYPPDSTRSTIDQMVDLTAEQRRTAQTRFLNFSSSGIEMTRLTVGEQVEDQWWSLYFSCWWTTEWLFHHLKLWLFLSRQRV